MSDQVSGASILSKAAGSTTFAHSPIEVRKRTLYLVADVFSAMVSASGRSEIRDARRASVLGTGPSTVVGERLGADPMLAALLNGLSVAAEQYQDGHRRGRGHPASHVVPAVFAAAESRSVSGEAFLSAVLAGYEVGVRVGTAMDGTPDGVHDIATWGTVGAAAGVAHVLSGGSPDIIEAAIEMSATMPMLPDAMTVFSGASAQHAFLGVGAHQGVVWGTLAMSGLRAPVGTLERHFALRSSRDFHPTALGGGLHSDGRFSAFSILDGYVKRHPTCAHLHGANDSIEAILARWDGSAEDIESVVVETYLAASVFNDVAPTNDLAARFSIPFSVAVALVTRRLDNSSFEPRWLNDKSVTSLADRVEVRHNPDFDDGYPSGRPTMVTIILRSGKRFVEYSALPRGDGADAMSDDFVVAKPRRLFESQISAERADLLLSTIDGLAASNVSVLSSALRGLFDSV